MIEFPILGWVFFLKDEETLEKPIPNGGKWMYFFNRTGADFANEMCKKAVQEGVVEESKHTDIDLLSIDTGVCCFYIDGTDADSHKRILKFFLENGMIPRNKNGNLRNISFKFDKETRAKEYASNFHAKINLSHFVDLKTGKFL